MQSNKKKRTKTFSRKKVKRPIKPLNIPLRNPYANLQASTVAYTPEDMELKTNKNKDVPSTSRSIPNMPIDYNLPSVNRTVNPSFTSSQPTPPTSSNIGMNEKGEALIRKYYQMAAKYGAEAACAYLAKNPIAGLSLAPVCGSVGSAIANVTVDPFISVVKKGLDFEKRMNEGINEALSDAWGYVKKIF
jgi:hypothetical protein